MMTRKTMVAGQFYPDETEPCQIAIEQHIRAAASIDRKDVRQAGGLVPHAGWVCSGTVAAGVFVALAETESPDVIVLFGGVHRYRGKRAAVFASGSWATPLGPIEIESELAGRILQSTHLFADDAEAHKDEHSLEVQMPFLRHVFPDVKVVPIMVPIDRSATEIGEAVAAAIVASQCAGLIVGTTDLTHYGPRYGFTPEGVGLDANAWAKNDNDRRFVDLVCSLDAAGLIPEAAERRNACNSGAAAATVAACVSLGSKRGVLLEQTTSAEVLSKGGGGQQTDSVGYAGIVFQE